MQPICTCLLLTYNHANFLKEAIESVINQKCEYPYIISIWDDASTDGSSDIIRKYAEKYPDLIEAHIADKNQGAQENIWNALKSVKTKYCALLETDDYWCDYNKLQKQIEALENNPECSFCGGQTLTKFSGDATNAQKKLLDTEYHFDPKYYKNINILDLEIVQKYRHHYRPHTSSIVFKTDCIQWDKINNKETLCWDKAFFWYLLLQGSLYLFKDLFSIYRVSQNSSWSTLNYAKKAKFECKRWLDLWEDTDDFLWKIIVQNIITYLNNYVNLDNKISNIGPSVNSDYTEIQKIDFLGIPVVKKISKKNKVYWKVLGIRILKISKYNEVEHTR